MDLAEAEGVDLGVVADVEVAAVAVEEASKRLPRAVFYEKHLKTNQQAENWTAARAVEPAGKTCVNTPSTTRLRDVVVLGSWLLWRRSGLSSCLPSSALDF